MKLMEIVPLNSHKEENDFLNELIKCEKLQKQLSENQDFINAIKKHTTNAFEMVIKTIIEITNDNKNSKKSNENLMSNIKLIYNGKEIKSVDKTLDMEENQHNVESFNEKLSMESQVNKKSELDRAIAEYLKSKSINFRNKYKLLSQDNFVSKRLKRQIKIRYLDDQLKTGKSKQVKGKPKQHEDELFVEIETHFDGKGTKGEKKKKLVRSLIDKIQKAINSNIEDSEQGKTVQQKRLLIKKRTQNPIDSNDLIINTISPVERIEHRQLTPISKTVNLRQPLTSVLDKSGETWKKMYSGPGFLTASKSLNSAEMSELNIDYDSVMKNGIPKRLQKPINTENEDLINLNNNTDMNNVTLFLKDINGSGFSIGINQYMDEPPDKETLNMFTGLENVIQAYHEHYDQTRTVSNESEEPTDYMGEIKHVVERRDLTKKNNNMIKKTKDYLENSGNDFFRENRHKRSVVNVKRFSNIRSKTKLNKFINTNAMSTKKIFLKGKRNKRNIDKIKIVASDRYPQTSRENIFLVSQEKIFANRAIVKEDDVPEVEVGDRNEENYNFITPYVNPYYIDMHNSQSDYLTSVYGSQSMHTGLMSKYPHIFVENISKSNEDFSNINPSKGGSTETKSFRKLEADNILNIENYNSLNKKNMSSTNVDNIVNAILPSRNNFKIVVKILPKNKTNLGLGYKEVHTLINKSYDKNGLRYISSLNVSEVSKLEHLNNTKEQIVGTTENNRELERQYQIKLLLELQKDRIDQQLEHLKMESQKLKQMIGKVIVKQNTSHLVDVFRQLGLQSVHNENYLPSIFNNSRVDVTTITNTPLPQFESTTKPLLSIKHPDHIKVLTAIKENENITKEILQKIDKNTDTLQLFLRKLVEEKQSTPQAVENTEKAIPVTTAKYLIGNELTDTFLKQLHRNFSFPIPFIYAFQHPVTENKDKSLKTIENVVYSGHIHTNKIGNDGNKRDILEGRTKFNIDINKKNSDNRAISGNQTRFFIDELENDFKLVSNVNDRIPILNAVKKNITKIM